MENFVSLLLFTFTAQTAIGLILSREIMITSGRLTMSGEAAVRSQYVITALLLLALATAFLHLHKPLHSIYALNNIKSSPLSMEIAALAFLTGVSVLAIILIRRGGAGVFSETILPVAGVVGALLLLFTMTAIYMLPAVPAWYRPLTPLSFILTTVSAGPAVMGALIMRYDAISGTRLMGVAVGGVILLAAAVLISVPTDNLLFIILIVLQVLTAALPGFLIFLYASCSLMNKKHHLTVITTVLILISGIVARLLFFLSFDNNIL
ncbi:MAG: dimethyl sulfoxide reductase anchor subunit [Bacteroidales bacterium]|nr:dimethyl sulfoxide reductase anchor subunit [Bacteroidales bacterium]